MYITLTSSMNMYDVDDILADVPIWLKLNIKSDIIFSSLTIKTLQICSETD